ncbi:MAG: DsbA family oxidoreductase [Deltaproteobacteria bacterium]|jgi:predicted DsbA family dithiol-disulfide isomerase|nr:DsbA family oxidoreductase [Deltaproteobacteria bacterium]
MTLRLEIWSDLACPWCFIGHRRLAQIKAQHPGWQLQHRAFELQPDLPAQGLPARAFYDRKFGGAARTEQMFARVTEVAAADGLRFDFSKMAKAPNTRLAHRVVQLCGEAGIQALDALFLGHFSEGVDLGDPQAIFEQLRRHQVPVEVESLAARLVDGEGEAEVVADQALARRLGISGVPLFLAVTGRQGPPLAVSGAQPAEVLSALLTEAAAGEDHRSVGGRGPG